MIKPHFFYCELYMVNIYFYNNVSPEDTSMSLKRFLKFNYPSERFEGSIGIAIDFYGDYVIWIKGNAKRDLSCLAHECLHIANMILSNKGIKVSLKNDEAQAYLLGYLMKKCCEVLK